MNATGTHLGAAKVLMHAGCVPVARVKCLCK